MLRCGAQNCAYIALINAQKFTYYAQYTIPQVLCFAIRFAVRCLIVTI